MIRMVRLPTVLLLAVAAALIAPGAAAQVEHAWANPGARVSSHGSGGDGCLRNWRPAALRARLLSVGVGAGGAGLAAALRCRSAALSLPVPSSALTQCLDSLHCPLL